MQRRHFLLTPVLSAMGQSAAPRQVSGVYPHLAMFNSQGECGTGAVVVWAGRLWVVTYSPHMPQGSDDKLYEIDEQLRQTIRPESIGGTPANRMIHRESNQLFIGPYVIDAQGRVKAIPYERMYGRPTGNARHLSDPAGKVYLATMEEGLYEVDVRTLAAKELYEDANKAVKRGVAKDLTGPLLPGYHGKGLYSGQGRVVYSNNGEVGGGLLPPDTPSGCLAEWNGKEWTVVRRNQFTEVTGPGGITGNAKPETDPVWAVGWDYRSVILMLLDGGKWHSYRLPKASHCYDGAHGWNTEWPRIREIGPNDWLMTMHGMFWRFPQTFTAANTRGIAPRSTYLKVIGDFTRWGDRVVLGCDDTAQNEFLNTRKAKGKIAGPGQSQSNLWFVAPEKLSQLGPPIGRGGVWVKDDVKAGEASEPYLFEGFAQRMLQVVHETGSDVELDVEVDRAGNGQWTLLRTVKAAGRGTMVSFAPNETGVWVRLKAKQEARKVTAYFQYAADDTRRVAAARPRNMAAGGWLWTTGEGKGTLLVATAEGLYEMDVTLRLKKVDDPARKEWMEKNLAPPEGALAVDAASVIYTDEKGQRWRLPKGIAVPGARVSREVSTERDLLHVGGTFYELPANNAGGMAVVRPVCTHQLPVKDYCSWRGLMVMSGAPETALGAGEWVKSDDGKVSLWVGVSDDLWQMGKPVGEGGPWQDTEVKAGEASDPYLMTGYDQKTLRLAHGNRGTLRVKVEVDITGTGVWAEYRTLEVRPGRGVAHTFPRGFHAYWVRLVAEEAARVSGTLIYR